MADSKFAQLTIDNKKIELPIHSPLPPAINVIVLSQDAVDVKPGS